jgi:hypothetical protein
MTDFSIQQPVTATPVTPTRTNGTDQTQSTGANMAPVVNGNPSKVGDTFEHTEATNVSEETNVEETTMEEEMTEPTIEERSADGFMVQHKSGMYPYGMANLLGVPQNNAKEFVKMYQEDNKMGEDGKTYSKHPFIRNEYTFSDGTTFEIQDTPASLQEKINNYKW